MSFPFNNRRIICSNFVLLHICICTYMYAYVYSYVCIHVYVCMYVLGFRFENGVLLMYTLEGISSVANFITAYEES